MNFGFGMNRGFSKGLASNAALAYISNMPQVNLLICPEVLLKTTIFCDFFLAVNQATAIIKLTHISTGIRSAIALWLPSIDLSTPVPCQNESN